MSGNVTIEYDACVVVDGKPGDRLSDLNCFWMASDPNASDIWKRMSWRNGVFVNCYSLQLYYLGYGGNYNSTTRFRRYDGNEAGVTDEKQRPAILKEYKDADHLLTANKWYHIKIQNKDNRVRYYIDGKQLIDFYDPSPLTADGSVSAPPCPEPASRTSNIRSKKKSRQKLRCTGLGKCRNRHALLVSEFRSSKGK